MPSWNQVLEEINSERERGSQQAVDLVRQKYLAALAAYTGRNVIAYYSGWLIRPQNTPNLAIGDDDKNAFMTMVHQLDRGLGLDLILHTPGGDAAATESLVDYLWSMFNRDIRVIVPQLAMSAGTMIACASREIVMGKQSSLGPIDPQLNGVPAAAVLDEFQLAIATIKKDPSSVPLWQTIVSKYPPAFLIACTQAIRWSREMVGNWLAQNMFNGQDDAIALGRTIANQLSDHNKSATHARHLGINECRTMGLNVRSLELDHQLQDLALTVHHAFMLTFSQTAAIKLVENHKGVAVCVMGGAPRPPAPRA